MEKWDLSINIILCCKMITLVRPIGVIDETDRLVEEDDLYVGKNTSFHNQYSFHNSYVL